MNGCSSIGSVRYTLCLQLLRCHSNGLESKLILRTGRTFSACAYVIDSE